MDLERLYGHTVYVDKLNDQSVVIDLGANRGRFARAVSRRFRCRPYCVEPNPELCEILKSQYNFAVCKAAIGAQNGKGLLNITKDDERSSLFAPTISPLADRVECDVVTFPELLNRLQLSRVNLLKIDIEGSEIEVLLSLPFDTLEIVEQISVEFHEADGVGTIEDAMRVFAHLRGAGFGVLRGSFFDYRDVLFLNLNQLPLNRLWRLGAGATLLRNGFARRLRRLRPSTSWVFG
jgi:FkbM family methyltransferase